MSCGPTINQKILTLQSKRVIAIEVAVGLAISEGMYLALSGDLPSCKSVRDKHDVAAPVSELAQPEGGKRRGTRCCANLKFSLSPVSCMQCTTKSHTRFRKLCLRGSAIHPPTTVARERKHARRLSERQIERESELKPLCCFGVLSQLVEEFLRKTLLFCWIYTSGNDKQETQLKHTVSPRCKANALYPDGFVKGKPLFVVVVSGVLS